MPGALVEPGAVVMTVGKGWAAELAGLQPGDVLLSWSQGESIITISSPFDLQRAEMLQREGAEVTLHGFRNHLAKSWRLPPDGWRLTARPNFQGDTLSRYLQGQQLANSDRLDEAARIWRQSIAAFDDDCMRAWLLFHIAETETNSHRWRETDGAFQDALNQGICLGPLLRAYLLRKWSSSFFTRGDPPGAKVRVEQALQEVAKEGTENILHADLVGSLGTAALRSGDPKAGQEYVSKGLEEMERLVPSSTWVANDLLNLGSAAMQAGDLHTARAYYGRVLEYSEKTPSHFSRWSAVQGMCVVALREGDLDRAQSHCNRASEALQREAPVSREFADSLVLLVQIYRERGDWEKARALAKQGLAIHQKVAPGSVDVAYDLINLGLIAEGEGKLEEATRLHLQALLLETRVNANSVEVANTLVNLCELARKQGDLAAAEEYCRSALAIQQVVAPGSRGHAEILKNLGDLAGDRGQKASAEEYYLQAIRFLELVTPRSSIFVGTLAACAKITRESGQRDAAAVLYQRALEALEGRTARLGGSSDLRADFRARNEAIYREYIDLLIAQDKPELALSVLERSRGRILLERLMAAHVDIHAGADPALLERERTLQADITAKSERRIQLLTDKHTEDQIKAVEKEIADLNGEYQDVEARLRISSPNYASLTQPQPLTAAEIQEQVLDQETLLLEYSLGEQQSHVFAVTPGGLQVFKLPRRAQIEQAARRVHNLLTARNRTYPGETAARRERRWSQADAVYPQAVRQLSRMILGPLAGRMRGKRLIIVADGALHYIPFVALPEPDGEGVPLAVHHEIASLPSASVLALLRQQYKGRLPAPLAVAVLADPVFDKHDARVSFRAAKASSSSPQRGELPTSKDPLPDFSTSELLTRSAADLGLRRNGALLLPRLPYTRQEAEAIRAVTPPAQLLEAVDFKANRAAATGPELANYRVVHFATHTLLNNRHPDLSGLVLSLVDDHGGLQDGFVTLHDIYNMNLPVEMVVLSACESGLGKEVSGEGLIGLTRGFMYAGASRVVASLWKVSDVATARLMTEFYRGMEKDGLSPAAALRAAQVKMWREKRWKSPYFWAAFQIQGEWR